MREWERAKLSEVATVNPRRPKLDCGDDEGTTFVPMSAVGEDGAGIVAAEIKPFAKVKKGYTYFENGDVIFAKITSCMQNGKHAIVRGCAHGFGFGSTEFHVIRPSERVTADWIHFFLIQPSMLEAASRNFTGAVGQQRLPDEYIANLTLPIPPVAEQRRIASRLSAALEEVGRARAAAEDRVRAANSLEESVLRECFARETMTDWSKLTLGDVGDVKSGITLGRKARGALVHKLPYLRVANVKEGHLALDVMKEIEVTDAEAEKYRLRLGDLVLTEGGDEDKLGRGTFWQEEIAHCLHQNHIFRVRLNEDRAIPSFVAAQLQSPYGKAYFLAHAKRTTGIATINQKVLKGFPLRLPATGVQEKTSRRITEWMAIIEDTMKAVREQMEGIDSLPSGLMSEVFGA